MIRTLRHDDVVQFELSSRRSRLAGFAVSAYLVRGVLVDCGFPAVGGEVARLLDQSRLRGVVLTHFHEDHAGNIEAVATRGIPVAAHADTLALVRAPAPIAFYRRFVWGSPAPLATPIVPLDLTDRTDLTLVATPGHSDEHHAVWDAERRTLFSGDLVIGVKVRIAHHYERPRALVESLRRVMALQPQRLFDAHRGLIAAPEALLRAKVTWLDDTIGRIAQMANDGVPAARIARVVLGRRDVNDFISGGEYSRLNFVHAVLHDVA